MRWLISLRSLPSSVPIPTETVAKQSPLLEEQISGNQEKKKQNLLIYFQEKKPNFLSSFFLPLYERKTWVIKSDLLIKLWKARN